MMVSLMQHFELWGANILTFQLPIKTCKLSLQLNEDFLHYQKVRQVENGQPIILQAQILFRFFHKVIAQCQYKQNK